MNLRIISGARHGRLITIRPETTTRRGTRWLCRCDCGNLTVAWQDDLRSGHTRSCGCLRGNRKRPQLADLPDMVALRGLIRSAIKELQAMGGSPGAVKNLKSALEIARTFRRKNRVSSPLTPEEWLHFKED